VCDLSSNDVAIGTGRVQLSAAKGQGSSLDLDLGGLSAYSLAIVLEGLSNHELHSPELK